MFLVSMVTCHNYSSVKPDCEVKILKKDKHPINLTFIRRSRTKATIGWSTSRTYIYFKR